MIRLNWRAVAALVLLLNLGACSRPDAPRADARPWRAFVEDLADPARLASLDIGGTRLLSSFDRTGGNDDFNNFKAPGTEPGWKTLAEVTGPGVVRRFWTTGVDPGHEFRIYFDGERKPRLSGTIDELFGDRFPFAPPLARMINLCWASYVPLTFQKSIRIEAQSPPVHPFWGPRKLFFHLNVESLPAGSAVETFPARLSEADRAAVEQVQVRWRDSVEWPRHDWGTTPVQAIAPGATGIVFQSERPGLLREWMLEVLPAAPAEWTQREKEYLLQDTVLRVTYDDAAAPSIEAPLGDFFGNAWRRRYYGSLLLGNGPDGFRCALPMPFARGARIELVNGADRPIQARFTGQLEALSVANPGYLHAEWRRSGPDAGRPHLIADLRGSGRFAGFFLGVTGHGVTQQDNSWWLLEGDEQMFVDGEARPSWHGTGLEDYFNGGWYYRGCAFNALNGIFDRAPFRVAQYRHQLVDPVAFTNTLKVQIERGDQNVSHGWFQSTAFAYLQAPGPVAAVPADRAARRAVEERYQRQTTMLQLLELERMNNYQQAIDLLAEYRERFPDAEENATYALRTLEYRRLLGEDVPEAEYLPFLDGRQGAAAAEQAKLLQWFRAAPNRALVGMNVNGQARLFLNGQEVLSGDQPYALQVAGVTLGDGPQQLAAQVEWRRQDAWFMAAVMTTNGFAGTGPGSRGIRAAPADWRTGPLTDAWQLMGGRDSARGVPDAPFIGGVPNAFPLMQAKAYPVGAADWGYYRGTAYYRMDFQAPLTTWPDFAVRMTGLAK
jgi:hypothetical protein